MISLFNFLDFNSGGNISFDEMLYSYYPILRKEAQQRHLVDRWLQQIEDSEKVFTSTGKRAKKTRKQTIPVEGFERLADAFFRQDSQKRGCKLLIIPDLDFKDFTAKLDEAFDRSLLQLLFDENSTNGLMDLKQYVRMVVSPHSNYDLSDLEVGVCKAVGPTYQTHSLAVLPLPAFTLEN